MAGVGKVFISHAHEDNALCIPLMGALSAWEIDYYFDPSPPDPSQPMSSLTQRALIECHVFLRVCAPNTQRSARMSQETAAFRTLQAQESRSGQGRRALINIILDPRYEREPFDNATILIDTINKPRFLWMGELARPLGISTAARRLSRRAALALGITGVAALASATSAGVLFVSRPSTPKKKDFTRVSGQLRWSQPTNARYSVGQLTLANGILYTTTDVGLLALDPTTGKSLWQAGQVTSDLDSGGPVVDGGTLYVGSGTGSGRLFALDAHSGSVRWSRSLGFGAISTPAVANGVVYTYTSDGMLSAHRTSSGERLWSAPISYQSFGEQLPAPAAAGGTVFVGALDHTLYALTAGDGSVKWRFPTRGPVISTPTVAGDTVYFGSVDGYVYALDAARGTLRWKYRTEGDVLSSPTVVNGVLYIGSQDRYLYALDGAAGFAYWRGLAGDLDPATGSLDARQVDNKPVLDDTFVYVTVRQFIYAYYIKDGKRAWRYGTSDDFSDSSSPVVAGDLVYFGSSDKKIYAINT